jgi:hypothetical protein
MLAGLHTAPPCPTDPTLFLMGLTAFGHGRSVPRIFYKSLRVFVARRGRGVCPERQSPPPAQKAQSGSAQGPCHRENRNSVSTGHKPGLRQNGSETLENWRKTGSFLQMNHLRMVCNKLHLLQTVRNWARHAAWPVARFLIRNGANPGNGEIGN